MSGESDDFEGARLVFSETAHARLGIFVDLLRKWNGAINLVSKSSLAAVWERHVVDSAQIFDAVPDAAGRWVDLGSGGGFPGVVIAILAEEQGLGLDVTLVESDLRKAEFLRAVSRETNTRVTVVSQRIEALAPLKADVVSARALAPLTDLCAFAERHLRPGGVAVFPKGATAKDEILSARQSWLFDLQQRQSTTDLAATILLLKGVTHV